VVTELAETAGIKPLTNKFAATGLAVVVGLAIAVFAGDSPGKGGLILWPLFGATNQLLAGLALMVAVFYLGRRSKPLAALAVPMFVMMLMPFWAITYDLWYNWIPAKEVVVINADETIQTVMKRDWVLIAFGTSILGLQVWMAVEGLLMWRKAKGIIEPSIESEVSLPATQGMAT
ncbi:MAG: carbon starvation CstA 5TM domain-containing protein, partial [Planctomycetota bacterium]